MEDLVISGIDLDTGYLTSSSKITLEGDFTVSYWNYKRNHSGYDIVFSTLNGTEPTFATSDIDNNLTGARIWANAYSLNSKATNPMKTWFHVAFVRSNGIFSLYIDGKLQGSLSNSSVITFNPTISLGNWGYVARGCPRDN